MPENCSHYWVEDYSYGDYTQRGFMCILCEEQKVKPHNKLMNYRESEPSRAWARLLSEAIGIAG